MIQRMPTSGLMRLACWVSAALAAGNLLAASATNQLEIRSISADTKPVPWRAGKEVHLPTSPKAVVFDFGPAAASSWQPARVRYKLEGYDQDWQAGGGAKMLLRLQFSRQKLEQTGRIEFESRGQSAGWNGSLETSRPTHRREELVVPLQSDHVMVMLTGRPGWTVGVWAIADLAISRLDAEDKSELLLRSPSDAEIRGTPDGATPPGWSRTGTRRSLAQVVELNWRTKIKALAIVDDDPQRYGDWRIGKELAPGVAPGERLVVEWKEAFDLGDATLHQAEYPKLLPGRYTFRVEALTALGSRTGIETAAAVLVPTALSHSPWFWAMMLVALGALMAAAIRYTVWHQVRRNLLHLKQERALDRERVRIAQDLHDDLGTRITEISLFSARAQADTAFPENARADFDRISRISRELVAALYETVWAVNPENDHLDAVGNFICLMVTRQCEPAQVRCRFDLLDLPQNVQISSQVRHNIILTVKEAVHNALKHAKASEVCVHARFTEPLLTVRIADNGCGFRLSDTPAGHGLGNMQRRLESIGGNCAIESEPVKGTSIRISLALPARNGSPPAGEPDPQVKL